MEKQVAQYIDKLELINPSNSELAILKEKYHLLLDKKEVLSKAVSANSQGAIQVP